MPTLGDFLMMAHDLLLVDTRINIRLSSPNLTKQTTPFAKKPTTFAERVAFSGEKSIMKCESELTLLIVRKTVRLQRQLFCICISWMQKIFMRIKLRESGGYSG